MPFIMGEKQRERIGFIPVIALVALIGLVFITGIRGTIYNEPLLVFVFQFIFVFCVSILVTIISARAYLLSGSLNILLIGIASLMSGVLLIIAQWGVTPSLGSTLTTNEATTIGNIGILLASILIFLSAILLWTGKIRFGSAPSRIIVLGTSYFIALVLIVGVFTMASSGLLPVFFISGVGSTTVRWEVLTASGIFLTASWLLFGWKYLKTRSSTLYWYTLGIVLFTISLIGIVYTVKIGDAINWCGRIGLYLAGAYFLMAVISRDTRLEKEAGLSERWAEAFRSSPQQIAALFANMTNGFVYGKIVTDSEGRPIDIIYLDMNRAYETYMGAKRETVLGRRATEAFPQLRNVSPDWFAPYGRAALKGESTTFESLWPVTGRWYSIIIYGPQKGYFAAITEDITERKKAEEELKRSNAELQQFAYVASHDLQEPLRMVTAYLSLLEKRYGDQLDGKAKEYMDFAVEGGLRARDLVRDLLEFSRVDSHSKPFQPTDMEKVLEEVMTNLKVQVHDEHATITHDTLPTIMADDLQMAQVLQNLLSNAIKFHGDLEPKVHISCQVKDQDCLFSVQDNGIGIDPQFKDKVFVLFQRLHNRQEYEGTGIGLAISKKIVERHGGRIWFESQVGKGTTFYFTIPKGSMK